MMYAVHKSEKEFVCVKYVNGNKVDGAEFKFDGIDKLKVFLLSIPNANSEEIELFLSSLKQSS